MMVKTSPDRSECDSYINISSTYIYYIRCCIIANRQAAGPNIYFLFMHSYIHRKLRYNKKRACIYLSYHFRPLVCVSFHKSHLNWLGVPKRYYNVILVPIYTASVMTPRYIIINIYCPVFSFIYFLCDACVYSLSTGKRDM